MKNLKRLAALILALALTVSLGAGVSAANVTLKSVGGDAPEYVSVTANTTSYSNRGNCSMYLIRGYGGSDGYKFLDKSEGAVSSYPASVTFTIKNNNSTEPCTVSFMAYNKQTEGKKSTWVWDEGEKIGNNYYVGDSSGSTYYLSKYWYKNAASAGSGLYWNTDYDGQVEIKPGKSVTVSFDSSLARDGYDVVYVLTVEWEELGSYSNYAFFLEKPVSGFTDVAKSAYYADAVTWAVKKGVTDGVSKTSFAPMSSVTRAEAVTFLWRAYGKPEPTTTTSKFKDVTDKSAYYYKAVLWAAENGITTGVSDTWFDLNSGLTYDEILTFLCRAAGGDASGDAWSDKALTWAKNNGVSANLKFSAKDKCPRSDVVYCLYNQLG
jgi:hypothetical protein